MSSAPYTYSHHSWRIWELGAQVAVQLMDSSKIHFARLTSENKIETRKFN